MKISKQMYHFFNVKCKLAWRQDYRLQANCLQANCLQANRLQANLETS